MATFGLVDCDQYHVFQDVIVSTKQQCPRAGTSYTLLPVDLT
jgi:hypothetical protein